MLLLFFIEIGCRRISLGGITHHPNREWMQQVARNATMEDSGYLKSCRYLRHDRDSKFCREFQDTLKAGVVCTPIPARSPNLNAYAERWVRTVNEECLSKLILFGEQSLRRVLSEYLIHFHYERNHQGKDNLPLFPDPSSSDSSSRRTVRCQDRLGGLNKFCSHCMSIMNKRAKLRRATPLEACPGFHRLPCSNS